MKESQLIEWKESWRNEYLKWNAFLLKKYGLHWDAVPLPLLLPEDLDNEAFRLFSQKAVQSKRLGDEILKESPAAMLKKLHLYGNLFQQVDKALDLLLTKYMKAYISYEGLQRLERYPFPAPALREALLNAVVHKDYSSGNPVQISVYDNKIIFWNAGKLPDQLTIDMLQTKHPSIPYNPLIASAFFRAGYIETWGRGIEKINNECSMAEVPLPEFNYQYAGLMITFFAGSVSNSMEAPEETKEESIEKTRVKTEKTRVKTRVKTEKTVEKTRVKTEKTREETREKTREKITIAIKENPEIRITELAKQLNLTKKGVEWQMNKLKESGRIIRIGPDKGGYWEVIGE